MFPLECGSLQSLIGYNETQHAVPMASCILEQSKLVYPHAIERALTIISQQLTNQGTNIEDEVEVPTIAQIEAVEQLIKDLLDVQEPQESMWHYRISAIYRDAQHLDASEERLKISAELDSQNWWAPWGQARILVSSAPQRCNDASN